MKLKYLYCLLITLLALSSCKKEYPNLPYTDLLNFSIKDANGETLKGAIENGEIIIYWPPQQAQPATISPEITVAEKASVSPSSGSAVPFSQNTSYTVTAEDGTSASYKLKIVVNSPLPVLNAVYGLMTYNTKVFINTSDVIQVAGDYFDKTPGNTKVVLINANNQEVEAKIESLNEITVSAFSDVPVGKYKAVKVVVNGKSVTYLQDFEVIVNTKPLVSDISFQQIRTLKRGDSFTFSGGTNVETITSIQLYDLSARVYRDVILKEAKSGTVTIQIPADFPLQNYTRLRYYYAAGAYYDASVSSFTFTNFPITITQ